MVVLSFVVSSPTNAVGQGRSQQGRHAPIVVSGFFTKKTGFAGT